MLALRLLLWPKRPPRGLLADPGASVSFKQPVSAERLVKMDLPALGLDPGQPRRLELHHAESDEWIRYDIDRFAVDGRVLLRRLDPPGRGVWTDLSEQRYRWVVGARERVREGRKGT